MTPVIPGVIPSIWNSLTYPSDFGGTSDKNQSTPIQVTGAGISPDKFPGLCRKPPREFFTHVEPEDLMVFGKTTLFPVQNILFSQVPC